MATPFMGATPALATPAQAPLSLAPTPDFSIDPSLTSGMSAADALMAEPIPEVPAFNSTLKLPEAKPSLTKGSGISSDEVIGMAAQAMAPGMAESAKALMRPSPKNLRVPDEFDLLKQIDPFELSEYWAALMARDPGRMKL